MADDFLGAAGFDAYHEMHIWQNMRSIDFFAPRLFALELQVVLVHENRRVSSDWILRIDGN